MVAKMSQKTREYLSFLLKEQEFECHLLLLVQKLLHDLEEVATQDGQRVLILVQELAERLDQAVVMLWQLRLFRSFCGDSSIGDSGFTIRLIFVFFVSSSGLSSLRDALLKSNRGQSWSLVLRCIIVQVKILIQRVNQLLFGVSTLQRIIIIRVSGCTHVLSSRGAIKAFLVYLLTF